MKSLCKSFGLSRRTARFLVAAGMCLGVVLCTAQTLSPKWEDLTSADFVKAIQQADGVCLLPFGSIDKFGPSGPLGTDLYLVRLITLEAVKKEYAVVFPGYYAGGTNDTSTLPGTIYYSARLQLDLLDETTREMARNGCKKILIVNGNSGNGTLISLFMGNFAATPHDYAVYNIYGSALSPNAVDGSRVAAAEASKTGVDGHGGEDRISAMLAYYPDLVHIDRAHDEPVTVGPGHPGDQPAASTTKPAGGAASQATTGAGAVPAQGAAGGGSGQTQPVQGITTKLSTGYGGDPSGATAVRGQALVQNGVGVLVKAIQTVKADKSTLNVQKEFYERRENPNAAK